jgi:hypothetical protein
MTFKVQPEKKLYPHLQVYKIMDLSISIDLNFTNINNAIADTTYLIDTVYFFEFDEKFMKYKRIFRYDDLFRIKFIIAEVLLDGTWLIHQLTKIHYNEMGNISEMNGARYEAKADSIILNYSYDNDGLLQSEVATEIVENDSLLIEGWKKRYFYVENNLSKYTFEKIGKPNWYISDSVICKYNQDNLPIERTDFIPIIQGLDSVKFIWKYNKQQIREYYFLTFENSDTLSIQFTKYEYGDDGKILKETIIDRDEYQDSPMQFGREYKYNNNGRLDSIYRSPETHFENSDPFLSSSAVTFAYDSKGFLVGSQKLGKYEGNYLGSRISYTRDSNNNVSFAKEEYMSQGIWKQGSSIRIVYRKK